MRSLLLRGAVLAVALVCALGCGRTLPPREAIPSDARLRGEDALRAASAFAVLGPRLPGTAGGKAAAEWLATHLRAAGLQPEVDVFLDDTPDGALSFRNVLARVPGRSDRLLVLVSHFDTKYGMPDDFQGANDSGSSTGILLALAPILRAHAPLPMEVLLAFVDGEECRVSYGPRDGLHGSRRLARQLAGRDVAGVLVLDMLGDEDLRMIIPRNVTRGSIARVLEAAERAGCRDRIRLSPGAVIDDHVPFVEAGFPTVLLIDFEYGSAPGRNDYWHTPEDSIDKLSADSLGMAGNLALEWLRLSF